MICAVQFLRCQHKSGGFQAPRDLSKQKRFLPWKWNRGKKHFLITGTAIGSVEFGLKERKSK